MQEEIFELVSKEYTIVFERIYQSCIEKHKKTASPISESAIAEYEKKAQLIAIKEAMIAGRKLFPQAIPSLWANIYKTHLYRKSGIKDPTIVEKAIQAEQSWRSASGHAFEIMIKELCTQSLEGTNIRYVLQKDLNLLLKANALANQPTDIAWLKNQVKGAVFDLYAIADIKIFNDESNQLEEKPICFGCVQCKTSIRDRVSRDILPSKEAMKSNFWSIAFVLDGTMLQVPKYQNMVNGHADSEFKKNGWHGVYVLSFNEHSNRIYGIDLDFSIIRCHTLQAFKTWHQDRMGFNSNWKSD